MLIIAYPVDEIFLHSRLVRIAQSDPQLRPLHDLLAEVYRDPKIQLALHLDFMPVDAPALWKGRPSTPVVVTGCLAVVRRLMGWSFRTLATEVNGSVGWRWVCQLYEQPMPNFRTIQEREAQLSPRTVQLIQTKVIRLGQASGVTTGTKMRVDSSVTESNIHYPTDSSLLNDSARVLSRLLHRARTVVPHTPAEADWFHDRHRQARRLARRIGNHARRARRSRKNTEKTSPKLYGQLIELVDQLVEQVGQVQPRLTQSTDLAARGLQAMFETYLPLVQRVVIQTRQRVLEHVALPAADKLVSLFEAHTAIIRRGKAKPNDTEFGHKIWYAEVEGGLIEEARLLTGNPPDAQQVIPSVKAHQRRFGKAPQELSGDRGTYSPKNEQAARALGVRRVSLPQPGHTSKAQQRREHQPWFRAAQRFRSGIEGRISQLRRARGLTRCLNHGWLGLERWVGWGVIANNLSVIATNLIKRHVSLAEALS